jgi:L-iditol 2-dehydrogenase
LKALVYTKPYSFEYSDFPDPVVGDDDVLVRVRACGICGSDVHGSTGKTGRRIPPLVMGHEAAGVVQGTGANVKGFRPDDRVCFDSTVYCNQCPSCRSGFFNRCRDRQVLGVSTPEFRRHGALAEYVAVPSWIVQKLPDSMSFTQAALLEPVSIGVHAAARAPISTDDTVLVLGAGTIGLFVLQAARLRGAARVIVCDLNEFRLDVARGLGADKTVNPQKADLKETVLAESGGRGANVAFEAVGYAATFQDAVSATATGGYVVAIGNLEKQAQFDLQDLVARELTFTGSYASSGEFRDCVGLIASGDINVEPLISDVMPLNEGARAFDRLVKAEENLLKIVLQP